MRTGTGNSKTPGMSLEGKIVFFHGGVLDEATRKIVGAAPPVARTFQLEHGETYRAGTNKDRVDFHIREVVQRWLSGEAFVITNHNGLAFIYVSNLEGGVLWHADGESQIIGHRGNSTQRRQVNLNHGDYLQIQGHPAGHTSQQMWFRFEVPDTAVPDIPTTQETDTLGFMIERDGVPNVEFVLGAHLWDVLTALCARSLVDVPGSSVLRAQTDAEVAVMSEVSPAVATYQARHAKGAKLTAKTAADRLKTIRETITETTGDPITEDRGGLTNNEMLLRWCLQNGVTDNLNPALAQQMFDHLRQASDDG